MISKYITKREGQEVRRGEVSPQPKVARARSERTHGGFVYRNVSFSYAVKGDRVVLHTWSGDTLNPGVSVPKSKRRQATWALARILLAEKELAALGAAEVSSPSNA